MNPGVEIGLKLSKFRGDSASLSGIAVNLGLSPAPSGAVPRVYEPWNCGGANHSGSSWIVNFWTVYITDVKDKYTVSGTHKIT